MASKKIFISPERRPAPHGKYWNMPVHEHDVCNDIADLLKPMLEHNGFEVVIAPHEHTLSQRSQWANSNGVDYYLCIHTNASGNGSKEGTATGCECLYYGNVGGNSYRANQLMYDELTKLYPSKRGIKDYSHFYENQHTNMVSCYPELAFHDNGKDAQWLVANKAAIAEALCKAVCAYHKVAYVPLSTEPADTTLLTRRIAELEGELLLAQTSIKHLEHKIQAATAVLQE